MFREKSAVKIMVVFNKNFIHSNIIINSFIVDKYTHDKKITPL